MGDTQTSTEGAQAAPVTQTPDSEQQAQLGTEPAQQETPSAPQIDQRRYESARWMANRLKLPESVVAKFSDQELVEFADSFAPQMAEMDDAFRARSELQRLKESQQAPATPQGAQHQGDLGSQIQSILGDSLEPQQAQELARLIASQAQPQQAYQQQLEALQSSIVEQQIEATRPTLAQRHPKLNEPGTWMKYKELLGRIAPGFEPHQRHQAEEMAARMASEVSTPVQPAVSDPNKQLGQMAPPTRTGNAPASQEDRQRAWAEKVALKHFGRP